MARDFDLLVREGVDEVPLFGSGRARRVARRKRILKNCATVLVLILVSGGVYIATQRTATSAVSLDEVIRRFRSEEPADIKTHAKHDAGSARDIPDVEAGAPVSEADLAVAPTVADEEIAKDILPKAGVYAYRTTGGERVSLFGAHHDYPAETFATVRRLGGCRWEARNDVVAEHTDIRTLCNDDHSFMQLRQERQVTFFGKKDGVAMDCDPPLTLYTSGDPVNTRTMTDCRDDEGNRVQIRSVFLGFHELDIGGQRVEAVHVRDNGTVSGRAEGTSMDELWLDPRTGLTLQWRRKVDTRATAFGGAKIRYQEEATFLLESLEPRN